MDRKALEITAQLAMLEMDKQEMAAFEREVDRMLEYFDQMARLPLDEIEPTTHIMAAGNRLRQDAVNKDSIADRILDLAPDRDARHIKIPAVLPDADSGGQS